MERKPRALAATGLLALAVTLSGTTGCAALDNTPHLGVQVLATRPHDNTAFTEGLEIDGDVLYESTGLEGKSGLRASTLGTGAQLARIDLDPQYFGEGVTRAGDTLWQLTWKNGIAFARDPSTLAERRQVHFDGEGWGLCTRGKSLVMSNGTSTLTFRDPMSFAPTGSIRLTSHTGARLNELDCAPDGTVYANDWPTNHILHIDPGSGRVLGDIDASGLLTPTQQAGADVLNGIADIPGTDHFLITGKNWPTAFEVRFVPR
ncbi:glutaminyl-peptide cyclotransferase [Nocardia jiangxiensis]|uniref:Glutaminyl-peptide cyclotransferase n=1 Tax=Nocardia jiangxiensis TaxID=282685 RepID=A0ABW6S0F8_9NOCA|nr:glutaminyl-peptide cyclotransferase [Nocardia jiangxiensis]